VENKKENLTAQVTQSIAILLSASKIQKNRQQMYATQNLTKEQLLEQGKLLAPKQWKSVTKNLMPDTLSAATQLQEALDNPKLNYNTLEFRELVSNFQSHLLLLLVIFCGGQRAHQIAQYLTGPGIRRTNIKNKDEFTVCVAYLNFDEEHFFLKTNLANVGLVLIDWLVGWLVGWLSFTFFRLVSFVALS
jgi:hypothetical protein